MGTKIKKHGIKISEAKAEIEAILEEINGRAATWTADYSSIKGVAQSAERMLEEAGLSQSARIGAVVFCEGFGPDSKSYRYAVVTTGFSLKRYRDGWRLMGAWRDDRKYGPTDWDLEISAEQARLITKTALRGFKAPTPIFEEAQAA